MQIPVNAKNVNENIILNFAFYDNGSTAISGVSLDGEPLFKATVAIDETPPPGHCFLKGWSENEGIPEALERAGVVELTGRTVKTGFCEALEAKVLKAD